MMNDVTPEIHTFPLGEFQTNCHVVREPGHDTCWIVDCGQQPDALLAFIDRSGLSPTAILLTHAHCDHIWGLDTARSKVGEIPVYLHEAERDWCANPMLNLSGLMGQPVSVGDPTDLLRGGETLTLVNSTWEVMHTPGHSPGSVCFVHRESNQAIVGDTLFAGSIGRVDFPTSDPDAMKESLRRMLTLPDEMVIHPGHGESSTIGRERASNPFVLDMTAW